MRKKVIAGNWKMNKNLEEGLALATEVANIAKDEVPSDVNVVICVPYISLASVSKVLNDKVALGAQNVHQKESGAYTGEISATMLTSVGVKYVIIGHSERREYFGETNQQLAEKVNIALANGLTPLFCCGETLQQREKGIHFDFVNSQLTESLFHLSADDLKKVVIAYEPIWAIGTGVTASDEQAQEMHAVLRAHLASKYGQAVAEEISILYGGSMKPDNAKGLLACKDIDGGLIGGASLKARDFVNIAKSY
ncbi:MAG: triose-phosphate isomerase [Cytophagaceae bacterium]